MENSEKKTRQSVYLPSEDVQRFDHALDTLDKANQILQIVASGMKPSEMEEGEGELRIEN
jgi:hypothetical protein